MSNHNIIQYLLIANIGDPIVILRMLAALLFRYINDDVRNHNDSRLKRKTWTREGNQLALHCYFRSNPSQRGYRKRMIENVRIFRPQATRLADQVRTIIKKGLFTDLEILEIHQKTHKQNYNTVPDISSGVIQKQPNENELPTSKNENTTLPNNAQPSNHITTHNQATISQRTTKQPYHNAQPSNHITRTKGKSRKYKENHE